MIDIVARFSENQGVISGGSRALLLGDFWALITLATPQGELCRVAWGGVRTCSLANLKKLKLPRIPPPGRRVHSIDPPHGSGYFIRRTQE